MRVPEPLVDEDDEPDECERSFRDGSVLGWQHSASCAGGVWLIAYDMPPRETEGEQEDATAAAAAAPAVGCASGGASTSWGKLEDPQLQPAMSAAKNAALRQLKLCMLRIADWLEHFEPGCDRAHWQASLEVAQSACALVPMMERLAHTVVAEKVFDHKGSLWLDEWFQQWTLRLWPCQTLAQLALRLLELEVSVVRREPTTGLAPGNKIQVRMQDAAGDVEWLDGAWRASGSTAAVAPGRRL